MYILCMCMHMYILCMYVCTYHEFQTCFWWRSNAYGTWKRHSLLFSISSKFFRRAKIYQPKLIKRRLISGEVFVVLYRLLFTLYVFNNCKTNTHFSLGEIGPFGGSCQIHGPPALSHLGSDCDEPDGGIKSPGILLNPAFSHECCPPRMHKSCFCVRFIAEHTRMLEDSTKVIIILL